MYVWIAAAVGLVAVGLTLKRILQSRRAPTQRIDVGDVSQGWVVEHRADRSEN